MMKAKLTDSIRLKVLSWTVTMIILISSCGKSDSETLDLPEKPEEEVVTTIKSGQTIKVMTYNIHHANPPAQSASVIDMAGIAAVINSEKPDFVALQEVDKNTRRSGINLNQAQDLASRTGMSVYFSKSLGYQDGEYGVAVLSKYPILTRTRYALPLAPGNSGEQRSVAMISVAAEGGSGRIYVASTHLEVSDADNKRVQVEELLRINSGIQSPLILGGDFNAVPADQTITSMKQSFTSGCPSACPYTYPAASPTRTIDYIFLNQAASSAFSVLSYRTNGEGQASDHKAVVAELKYNN